MLNLQELTSEGPAGSCQEAHVHRGELDASGVYVIL